MSYPLVLCVDDDLAVLDMTRRVLEASGFSVSTAASGSSALQLANHRCPDAAVLDFSMPEMNGETLARELRQACPGVPIIFFSGSPEQLPDSALQVADAMVQKGGPVFTLSDVVRGLLGRTPRRGHLRRPISAPVAVRLHRPGAPATIVGRSFDISEGGIGGALDGSLVRGQVVWMAIHLPRIERQLSTAARVAYRNGERHGFQFLALPDSQVHLIRAALEAA